MIASVSLLKTHKFNKEKDLLYNVGHGLLLEERRAFDFCFLFFFKVSYLGWEWRVASRL